MGGRVRLQNSRTLKDVKLKFLCRDEDIAEVQLAHLQNVLEIHGLHQFQNLPLNLRVELSATLLASSVFASDGWNGQAVHLAKKITDDLPLCYLQPWVARRQASLLQRPEDDDDLVSRLSFHGTRTDTRFYAQCGRLTACLSEQLIRRNQMDLAQAKLQQWEPRNIPHPPKLERMAHFHYKFVKAKVLRFKGHLNAAATILVQLLKDDVYLSTTNWVQWRIVSHSADVFCELGRPRLAIRVLYRLRGLRVRNNDLLESQRLSTAEALAQTGHSKLARRQLLAIKDKYDRTASKLSKVAEMTHVRTCISLARISHGNKDWQSAFNDWYEAGTVVQKYEWGGEFTYGVIQYSLSHVIEKLQRNDLSGTSREVSEQILRREGRQDWIPLVLGTQWSHFARHHLDYHPALHPFMEGK